MFLLALASGLAAPVTPGFGWKPGDAWTVSYTETMSRTGTGPAVKATTSARWTLSVGGAPGALEMRVSNYKLDGPTGVPAGDGALLYARALLASAPSFRVDGRGALGELLDLPKQRSAADAALGVLPEDARRIAQSTLSDARLKVMVTDWWTGLVGAWVGAPLVPGQPDAFAATAPVPALANAVVQTDSTRVYDGPAACVAGAAATCEAFTLRSVLNPSAAGVAIGEFSRRPGALAVASLSQETTAHLVTEADDLRPRSLTVERKTRTRGSASTTAVDVSSVETRTWTFTPTK